MIKPPYRVIALLVARATMLAYPELVPALVDRLGARKVRVLLTVLPHEGDSRPAVAELGGLAVYGIVSAVRLDEDDLRALSDRGLPVLLYNCHAQQPSCDSVSCDHGACGHLLADQLLRGGHRRFGIIAAPRDSLVGVERVAGAMDTLRRRDALTVEVEVGDYSYASGAAALDALFARMKPRPSAIIAANDAMAIGALDRARQLKARVPRDLSIVGIDGTGTAALPSYELTTVRQPLDRMADAACELLLQRFAQPGRAAEVRLFGGELIRGRTARFRPRRAPTPG